jgi:hypothetical protein
MPTVSITDLCPGLADAYLSVVGLVEADDVANGGVRIRDHACRELEDAMSAAH